MIFYLFIPMIVHFLVQPYQSRVLNITDTLLVDLNFLIALMQPNSEKSLTRTVAVHTLVVGPVLCIVVLFTCVCILKCGMYNCLHRVWVRRSQHSAYEQQHNEEHEQPPQIPVQEVHILVTENHSLE